MFFGFDAITVAYGKNVVLRDVTLEISRGSIVTLIGKNGCGKSSLVGTVFGASPAGGRVMLDGKPLAAYPKNELARRIGYLAQSHSAPPDLDVGTLVSLGRYPHMRHGRLSREDRDAVERTLFLTGLDKIRNQPVASLSGGERQRAWIAMTIVKQPEILILDEPTTSLDIGCALDTLELISSLRRELGITVLMVLHDLNLAARYSDRLCAMGGGGIYASGTPRELLTEKTLRDVFGIGAEIAWDAAHDCPYIIPHGTNKEDFS